MITLVTGTPGAGKTLWNVNNILTNLLKTGRPIYSNINGLSIDDPNVTIVDDDVMTKWMDYPDGSIFIFDECQTVYRPRASGAKVPDYIAKFETHRHHGFDFYLITQYPGFIDKNIRELVGLHVHLYRPFNLKRSQVFEWPAVNPDPNPAQSAATASRKQFVFPKSAYQHYKSASQHTMKVRLPWGPILMVLASMLVAVAGSLYAFRSVFPAAPAASISTDATQSPVDSLTGDTKDRRADYPQETAQAETCRYRGRVGNVFLFTHSSKGNVAFSRESVVANCPAIY